MDNDWDTKVELARSLGIRPPTHEEATRYIEDCLTLLSMKRIQEEMAARKAKPQKPSSPHMAGSDAKRDFGEGQGANQNIQSFDTVTHFKQTNPIANQSNMQRQDMANSIKNTSRYYWSK